MSIHTLNCFTCNARIPSRLRTGALCLLIETDQGLALVDTGPGSRDYVAKPGMLRVFQAITICPLDPQEAAVRQVARLGYRPEDVRHIILTHMHFDHCGGLPDFPHARVHVHRREFEAFTGRWQRWTDMAYVRRHIAHGPDWVLYEDTGEKWYDFDAIRLPFDPQIWLVPLHGHTRGQCGVAVRAASGWLFHLADSAAIQSDVQAPEWLVRLVLGPHNSRLQRFAAAHPEIRVTTGHMAPAFFIENPVF